MPHECMPVKPKERKQWSVWTMFAGTPKQPWVARMYAQADDADDAESKAYDAMDEFGEEVYVYALLWSRGAHRPQVRFDSLSGWRVKGNPLPAVRRLLSPEGCI